MKPDQVETTKPDKLFFPADGVSKGDVVDHYRSVAEVMVPHLRGRPLTLRRFPDGIEGEGWFQKEAADHFPDWIRVEDIPQRESGTVRHVICDDAATAAYLANQGTIEFHVWPSTVDALGNPDLLVIDLDPPRGTPVVELRKVVRAVRDLYADLGLTPFLQATGGRGFHVVAPLDATTPYDDVRALALAAAEHLAADRPDRLTTAHRKESRGNRIYLDTGRNAYGQTFVAPYSLRARPGAAVATPLGWNELTTAEPAGWNPATVRRRLTQKADPWQDIHQHAGSAERARERLGKIV